LGKNKKYINVTILQGLFSYLGVGVDEVFEVLVLAHDGFADDVVVVDAHGGREGGCCRLGQPCQLLGLLEVLQDG